MAGLKALVKRLVSSGRPIAAWNKDRIDYELGQAQYEPRSMLLVSPNNFIGATTSRKYRPYIYDEAAAADYLPKALRMEDSPFVGTTRGDVRIDATAHDGRHRMAYLADTVGVDLAPLVLKRYAQGPLSLLRASKYDRWLPDGSGWGGTSDPQQFMQLRPRVEVPLLQENRALLEDLMRQLQDYSEFDFRHGGLVRRAE